MLFSAPTGFMAPPLPGVFVAVSCSGTLELGSPFRVRVHSNYSVVVAIWTFVVCAIYTCPVIGVRCCKAWDIHPVFENMFFSFQILVLSYELFISLAFFSHYPGDNQSHEVYLQLSDETIILCLQTLLDLFTSRVRPPWTLLGLSHIRKLGMGILKHPAGGGLHGGTTPTGCSFSFFVIRVIDLPSLFSATNQVMTNHTRNNVQNLTGKLYFVCKHCWLYLRHVSTLHEPCRGCAILESMGWEFWTPGRGRSAWWRHPCWMFISHFIQLDSHWIIQDVMIFQSWPIPHKLCVVNHQGWSSLLHLFKLRRWSFFIRMSLDSRSFWL